MNTETQHWTEESADAFGHRIAFDFIAQLENRMDSLPMKQTDLAKKLGVSEGAVSKLLNNPQNLTIRTIAKYSRALGLKAAIVSYDDSDPGNEKGPINSDVFAICWEHAGKPRDYWALNSLPDRTTNTTYNFAVFDVNIFCTYSTASGMELQQASAQPSLFWSCNSVANFNSTGSNFLLNKQNA